MTTQPNSYTRPASDAGFSLELEAQRNATFAQMVEALRFYADRYHYANYELMGEEIAEGTTSIDYDNGTRARKALKAAREAGML